MKLNFYHLDNLMIKLQEFVVTKKPKISQVKECVLSNSEEVPIVLYAFLMLV